MSVPDRAAVYLDHAATTPMLPEVVEAITEQWARTGNPSSLHGSGRAARRVVEESRERIAASLGARPSEVVFTSGGTESDNHAVKGIFWSRRTDTRRRVLAGATEHHAVLDPVEWLGEHEGADVTWLPVDQAGRVDVAATEAGLDDRVALLTVMWANNEVGTLQPVHELAELAHAHGVPMHSDAVQAVGSVPVDFAASGLDAMTLTAHKIGGPYAVGALLVRRELTPTPLLHGGGQERKIRSGTLDAPGIAGFAVAVEYAVKRQADLAGRLSVLRDDLIAAIVEQIPDARLNGDPVDRLPGNVHLSFPGCEGDSLLMLLDGLGIECSTGSACSAGVPQPSHVLLAMGRDEAEARSSLRFSLGHTTTAAEVAAVVDAIGPVVARARAALR